MDYKGQEKLPLTPKQKDILDFLEKHFVKHGFCPTYKEIAEQFGYKSDSSVAQYLDALEEKGYIKKTTLNRGIKLLNTGSELIKIPLLGTISAGPGIEPVEIPEPIDVPSTMLPRRPEMCYALKVSGNSMIDDGIADGDIVLVKHQNTAENGETVVAITENGATLKRFYKQRGEIRLEPRNPELNNIYPKELEIRGKFLGLLRHASK
ncbi:repressor LexA [Candidatus Nomurabacteria bacterium]|nr:repressor LexA [Candidatus Nomurabacteria bacterium]MCB9827907.1 repressor LexA [Candidatus Nomurabacteria bacterium]